MSHHRSNRIEDAKIRFTAAWGIAGGDVELLPVEAVDDGLTFITENWNRPWATGPMSELFGCEVTMTDVDPPDGHEDFNGPREFIYHIGSRHFRKMGYYESHVGVEIDAYGTLEQVVPRTYTAVVHDWAPL